MQDAKLIEVCERLVEQGVLQESAYKTALSIQQINQEDLGAILERMGAVSHDRLQAELAKVYAQSALSKAKEEEQRASSLASANRKKDRIQGGTQQQPTTREGTKSEKATQVLQALGSVTSLDELLPPAPRSSPLHVGEPSSSPSLEELANTPEDLRKPPPSSGTHPLPSAPTSHHALTASGDPQKSRFFPLRAPDSSTLFSAAPSSSVSLASPLGQSPHSSSNAREERGMRRADAHTLSMYEPPKPLNPIDFLDDLLPPHSSPLLPDVESAQLKEQIQSIRQDPVLRIMDTPRRVELPNDLSFLQPRATQGDLAALASGQHHPVDPLALLPSEKAAPLQPPLSAPSLPKAKEEEQSASPKEQAIRSLRQADYVASSSEDALEAIGSKGQMRVWPPKKETRQTPQELDAVSASSVSLPSEKAASPKNIAASFLKPTKDTQDMLFEQSEYDAVLAAFPQEALAELEEAASPAQVFGKRSDVSVLPDSSGDSGENVAEEQASTSAEIFPIAPSLEAELTPTSADVLPVIEIPAHLKNPPSSPAAMPQKNKEKEDAQLGDAVREAARILLPTSEGKAIREVAHLSVHSVDHAQEMGRILVPSGRDYHTMPDGYLPSLLAEEPLREEPDFDLRKKPSDGHDTIEFPRIQPPHLPSRSSRSDEYSLAESQAKRPSETALKVVEKPKQPLHLALQILLGSLFVLSLSFALWFFLLREHQQPHPSHLPIEENQPTSRQLPSEKQKKLTVKKDKSLRQGEGGAAQGKKAKGGGLPKKRPLEEREGWRWDPKRERYIAE